MQNPRITNPQIIEVTRDLLNLRDKSDSESEARASDRLNELDDLLDSENIQLPLAVPVSDTEIVMVEDDSLTLIPIDFES